MNISNRETAKLYRKSGEYAQAVRIYKKLWDNREDNWDYWLGWEYADSLKRLGELEDVINICKKTFLKWRTFKHNNDLLCWTLYEKYIKPISQNSTDAEKKQMLDIADFIIHTIEHEGKKSAYESTVFKVIDILKSQNNINYKEVLSWLNTLNYTILSDKVITFKLQDGTKKEGASRIEDYFSIKTKALEKLERYEECIECCKIALSTIKKFHYDDDIWISVRYYYSICMISEGEEFNKAITELEMIADKKNHWSIYDKVFSSYFKNGQLKKAINFGSRALISKDPLDKKVALLFKYALALEKLGDYQNAAKHFLFLHSIRKEFGWSEKQEIKEKLKLYVLDPGMNVNINEIYSFWISFIQSNNKTLKGVIKNIMPHGKSGFIDTNNGQSYFFRKKSIISGYKFVNVGSTVIFRIIDSFDSKKQIKSQEAVDIVIEMRK